MRKCISDKTIKAIFSKSGNLCAFPDCKEKLVYDDYKVMGEIAHIEAYSNNGPRFNPNLKVEERNNAGNLICLCCNHHKLIDEYPELYTVEKLKKIKKEHEKKYSGTYSFDFDRIFEVNSNLKRYLKDVKQVNTKYYSIPKELRKKVDVNKDFNSIINDINLNIKYINELQLDLLNYFEKLNNNIVKRLKKLKYDSKKWEESDDNDFVCPFWKELAIFLSDSLDDIKISLAHIEVLYYSECSKTNVDKNIEDLLKKSKDNFKKLCKDACYYD